MNLLSNLKNLRLKMYIFLFCCHKIKNNKIIFWANNFKHFGCNPKYIALYLLKHYPQKFDLVWVFEHGREIPEDLPEEIRVVRYFSVSYLRELHTAKFVICNSRMNQDHMWKKRKEQKYIQTWHSSLRLKKIEGDASKTLSTKYVQNAKIDSKRIDLLLSGSEFSTNIFRNAFWYDGEILKSGTPRCDILIKNTNETRKKVFCYYNIPKNHKFILYAPTFRDNKNDDVYGMDFKLLNKALEKMDNTCTIGCRLHPNISKDNSNEYCISMSRYSDMQELIAAADLLITDYSSCMFDMALAKKPCILYVPDLENYIANERGLYFDIKNLPFPIAKNMEDLITAINQFDNNEYQKRLQEFMCTIGNYEDGIAAKRVAQYINIIMNESRKEPSD